MTAYEYRACRIARGAWPAFTRAVFERCAPETEAAGGRVSGLFAGLIGLANDEAVLLRAWPDAGSLARDAAGTLADDSIVSADIAVLEPTVRPEGVVQIGAPGVYAHRWFWLQDGDIAEFVRLSDELIWPFFEADGCRIVGLWRDVYERPHAKLLLITRYDSVAHWERTRPLVSTAPEGVDPKLFAQAGEGVRLRARITTRSSVVLTRLVLPGAT